MHSSEDDHTFSESGLGGIEATLQRELDTVQTVYFPTEVERYSSSDSEGESFFSFTSPPLFQNSYFKFKHNNITLIITPTILIFTSSNQRLEKCVRPKGGRRGGFCYSLVFPMMASFNFRRIWAKGGR